MRGERSGSPAVVTEGLVVDVGAVRALDRLSLQVPAGVIFGLLGPNGAGKSTTVRALLGLVRPAAGSTRVLGFDPVRNGVEVRRRCGALLEDAGLYGRLSAEDNLELYGRIWNLPRAERRTRIRELLVRNGLWERRRDAVGGWSRGMRQRLAVARALLPRPRLLLLDEPTAGLDPGAARELWDELRGTVDSSGVTVLLTTHAVGEAAERCDLVGILRAGRLVASGRPRDFVGDGVAPEEAFRDVVERGV